MAETDNLLPSEISDFGALPSARTRSIATREPSQQRMWINLVILAFSFTLAFSAYMAIQNLQSSLYQAGGLGVATLTGVYSGATLSCIVAPSIIYHLGYKTSIAISMFVHIIFVGANFYPAFPTLIPAGIFVGLITGPIWTAQGSYVTSLALRYAANFDLDTLATVSSMSGVFFAIFLTSNIWGNVISSVILTYNLNDSSKVTNNIKCGIQFCPEMSQIFNQTIPRIQIYIMLGVFLLVVIMGLLLVLVFLDPIDHRNYTPVLRRDCQTLETSEIGPSDEVGNNNENDGSAHGPMRGGEDVTCKPILDTLRLLVSPRMLPLIPLLGYIGLEQTWIYGEFTQAVISCHLGIGMVGYCLAMVGVMNSVSSLLFGRLEKHIGITPFFTYAACANISVLVALQFWSPNTLLYTMVLTGVWGSADGIWQAGVTALLGFLFSHQKELAYAVFRFLASLMSAIAFGYSGALCMVVKTYITLGTCLMSFLGYIIHVLIQKYRVQCTHS